MLLSLLLFIPGTLAGYSIVCRDGTGVTRIQGAIDEAIKMARNARNQISDLSKDTTKMAFDPLFKAGDVGTLSTYYSVIENIASTALQVTFYCDSGFIEWTDSYNLWVDTAYTYTDKEGKTRSVSLYRVGNDHSKKPGVAQGSSFTTLGYKKTLPDGSVADFSQQAHIMISKKRWDPPAGDGLDHRSLDTVVKDGLLDGFTALDSLKPLSETVFHELMHAIGGTVKPDEGVKRITDKAIPPLVPGQIYGYKQCVKVNKERENFIGGLFGITPLNRAECPMMLAKALYLQIQGNPTYWELGNVDKTTLKAAGIPAAPNPLKMKRENVWYA